MSSTQQVRRRLPAEERRRQLLDIAAEIVVRVGQQGLTMEGLAESAGVSNGLVYLYFRNRADVLLAILDEHWEAFDAEVGAVRQTDQSFEERLRMQTRIYLHAVPSRGPAFRRLNFEPSVEPTVEERRQERRNDFLARAARQYRKEFGVPAPVARTAATLLLGCIETGADLCAQGAAAMRLVEDLHVAIVVGGMREYVKRTM